MTRAPDGKQHRRELLLERCRRQREELSRIAGSAIATRQQVRDLLRAIRFARRLRRLLTLD